MTGARPESALERLRRLEARRAEGVVDAAPRPSSGDPDRPDAPAAQHAHGPSPAARRGLGGGLAVLALLLWKFKAVLLLVLSKLKLLLVGLKLLKFGKLVSTSWTMLLSMWVYSLYFGAPFAIGFVLLILVHELGHGLAARLTGLKVGAPVFIPFFGAFIALKERPRTTFQDFVIGVGGPAAGSLGALACLGASPYAGEHWGQLLYALAYFALVINLFNLIPVWQLDGARIAAPFRVSMWGLAVGILALVSLWASGETGHFNPIALFVVLAGGYRLVRAWWIRRKDGGAGAASMRGRLAEADRRRHVTRDLDVSERQRWIAWASYTALAALLIAGVHLLQPGLPQVGG